MKKNRSLSAVLIFTAVVAVMAQGVFASPSHPVFGTFVNDNGVPSGSVLVLNIALQVTNDEDSGFVGYWALDNYNKKVQVWQAPDNSFYAVVRYAGSFQTFAGALSPQHGSIEGSNASGTFEGGYVATFNGIFAPGSQKTNGFIGTFDFGGTESDILKGTYGAGQTGPTTVYSWLGKYFSGVSDFAQPNWGWTYHYKSQTWYNYASGSSGDIVT